MKKPTILYHDDKEWVRKSYADKLRRELSRLANTVDKSLLLDEKLADDWGTLRGAVVAARKVLGDDV